MDLDEVTKILATEKPMTWGKFFTPALLAEMPQECHEAILDKLPQAGAIANREFGWLRVLSVAFNVHIQGKDRNVPFPVDFCVRCNGEQAGVNLLVRPKPGKFRKKMLEGVATGRGADFFVVMAHLADKHGLNHYSDYDLLLLKTSRPACPAGWQWGTAGGVFEVDDTAENVSLRETKDEFKGFTYLAWAPLLPQQLYQSGNVFELQTVGVVFGYLPDETKVETELDEGIADWKTVPLERALEFLKDINAKPWKGAFIWPDGKIHHGLLQLMEELLDYGITY